MVVRIASMSRPSARNLDHHLQRHGNVYRVRLEVPAALRPKFKGQRFLIHSLGPVTQSQARILRDPVLSGFRLLITQARDPDDPVLQRAREIRRDWELADSDEDTELAFMDAMEIADKVEAAEGEEAGTNIFHVAVGIAIPLKDYLDAWIADIGCTGKTALLHRKAFTVLEQWCKANHVKPILQAITGKVAHRFIEKHLKVSLGATKTVNRYLSSYRTHWRWLKRQHHLEDNPWTDTHVAERPSVYTSADDDNAGKRAFTDAEMRKLLRGNAPGVLPDLMLVAALTGARIDAVCSLRVRDCTGGAFAFKRQKREPRGRSVPIHSKLTAIVKRRSKGKDPDAFIFEELPEATPSRPRSSPASQAFTRYRRKVGVGAGEGEASDADFHSFRRWFTTKAEQAGQPPHIIDFVTGHKRPGETLGRYSQGPSIEQMRECVEAVKLPR
jgi:integrase